MARTKVLASLLLLTAASCKQAQQPASATNSGFLNTDCNSAKAEYDLQKGKLEKAVDAYVDGYKAFRDKRIAAAGTATATGGNAGTETAAGQQPPQQPPATEEGGMSLTDGDGNADAGGPLPAPTPDDAERKPDDCPGCIKFVNVKFTEKSGRVSSDPGYSVLDEKDFAQNARECEDMYRTKDEGLYNKCRDVYVLFFKLDDLVKRFNNKDRKGNVVFEQEKDDIYRECRNGGQGASNIDPEIFAFCDTACDFGDAECTKCNLKFVDPFGLKGNEPVICGSKLSVKDVGDAFCRKMGSAGTKDCDIDESSCVTKAGKEFTGEFAGRRVSGATVSVDNKAGNLFAGVAGNIEYKGGFVAGASASVTGNLGGAIRFVEFNSNKDPFTPAGTCYSNTMYKCEISLQTFVVAQGQGEVGVGGAFKLFGNGVEGKAVFQAGVSVNLGTDVTKTTDFLPCGGLTEGLMYQQCKKYVIEFAKKDLYGKVKDKVAQKIEGLIADLNRKEQAAREAAAAAQKNAVDAGKQAGERVYKKHDPTVGVSKACYCHNWHCRGARSASSQAQGSCGEERDNFTNGGGQYGDDFYNNCMAEVDRICNS